MPCFAKMRTAFTSAIGRDHCPALLVAGMEEAHSRTEWGTPEVLAALPTAGECWGDSEILLSDIKKLLIKR